MIRRPPRSTPFPTRRSSDLRRDIAGGYLRKGANRVGFQVAAYDTRQPLVIDPVVLSYSTYLGGSAAASRSEEHTSELQSRQYLVCRLLLEKKKKRHFR